MANENTISGKQVSLGFLIGASLNVALFICYGFSKSIDAFVPGFTKISFEGVLFIGAAQLIYQVPAIALFSRRSRRGIVRGIVLAASLTMLLNAACWGFVFANTAPIRPSYQNHHIQGAVAFSPDGQYIAFSYVKGSSGFLYRARLDGSECKRITNHTKGFELNPAFSPDGKQVAYEYSDNEHGGYAIFIADIQTGFFRPLVNLSDEDAWPIFAPDGKKIYFVRSISLTKYRLVVIHPWFERDLFSIGIDGSNLEQITNQGYWFISAPSISADGRMLLFRAWPQPRTGKPPQIIILDSSKRQQELKPNMSSFDPWFWPNGSSWIFTNGNSDRNLYRADTPQESAAKFVAKLPDYADNPRPSPDGSFIAFVAPQLQRSPNQGEIDLENLQSIYFINADGSGLRRVKFPVEVE